MKLRSFENYVDIHQQTTANQMKISIDFYDLIVHTVSGRSGTVNSDNCFSKLFCLKFYVNNEKAFQLPICIGIFLVISLGFESSLLKICNSVDSVKRK